MLRLLADENLNSAIVHGLRTRNAQLDIVTVQEAGLAGTADPLLLEWAVRERRVLLTHDANTIPRFAYERLGYAGPPAAVVIIQPSARLVDVLYDLELILETLKFEEAAQSILYVPL